MHGIKKMSLVAAFCTVLMMLLALSFHSPIPNYSVAIQFVENSDSSRGPTAKLRLSNGGATPVRIDPYCTVYWTNQFGALTNSFFKHDKGCTVLQPNQSCLFLILHPHDAKVWQPSFTYQIEPEFMTRIANRLRFWLPGTWIPDNTFIGRFGPSITNPLPVLISAPSVLE